MNNELSKDFIPDKFDLALQKVLPFYGVDHDPILREYYRHPSNVIKLVDSRSKRWNDALNPYILMEGSVIDLLNLFIVLIDFNRSEFIQYSDEIIVSLLNMRNLIIVWREDNNDKSDAIAKDLAKIMENIHLTGQRAFDLYDFFKQIGGNDSMFTSKTGISISNDFDEDLKLHI